MTSAGNWQEKLPRIGGRLLFALLLTLVPAGASAQGGEWPTLSDMGLEYLSRSGFLQVSISGQLDLEMMRAGDSWAGLVDHRGDGGGVADDILRCLECHPGTARNDGGGTFAPYRLRAFADIFLGDHLYSLLEVRSDRGHAPSDGPSVTRLEQAFVRVTGLSGAAGLQAGRFASPFGSYPLRHLTIADPFLRPPLPYDYRTVMARTLEPPDASQILGWKDAPLFFRRSGTPAVWDVPYQWGAMLFGTIGPFDLRLAAMNSAPSSDPEAWDLDRERFKHPSIVAGARVRPTASLDFGISVSRGPWMERMIRENPPPDHVPPSIFDFNQEIISADFTFERGPMVLRGEAMLDRWDIPNAVERPAERLYSMELQWDLWAGVSAATRVGYIDFRPLDFDPGASQPEEWDYDVYRYEASLGYRLARNAGILVSAYRQIQRQAEDGDTSLLGARLWWAF